MNPTLCLPVRAATPFRVALFALILVATPVLTRASGPVRFASGGHARVPFQLLSGHVWVRGVLEHSDSLWFVIDTGASSSVMDDALARSLGFEPRGQHQAFGAGGPQLGSSIEDVTIAIDGLSIHRDRLDTIDLAALSSQGTHPMQLILGAELFQACIVRFDYAAGIMEVWDAAHAPRDAAAWLPLTFERNHPYVQGTLAIPGRTPLSGRFVLDTGSSAGLLLSPDVVARESLPQAFPRTLHSIGRGVGGELHSQVGRAESLTLGELRFANPLVVMPDTGTGFITAAGAIGNIGGQLLGRCRVTFDYARKRVAFEPAAGFDRPFESDMSGIAYTREPLGWRVRIVNPESPAAESGLRVGDLLTQVDGESATQLDLTTMRRRLQVEGASVRLGYRRGAEDSEVTLKLRRLI